MAGATRFIDKLKKAARLEPVKKEVQLESGDIVVMYVTPLTAALYANAPRKTPALTTQVSSLFSCWCVKLATATANPSLPPVTSPF